ncbi:GldG family protein [Acanthopleuribacter pedis]|uniref:GldG family protein n=1 Tax=Acanthopleuribacter pedis TaxID=442870 RepID=A0A8J7Q7T9_9BACT|nr:GldG family protein [Acanthopleuribacter pedis]MBO1319981.1 GldG family protein [Acanthopleuribacter pedis]
MLRNLFGLLALAGLAAATQWIPLRWDLTEEGRHTLSDTSRKMVARLEDVLTIEVLVSEAPPAHLRPHLQRLTTLLQQYSQAGGGKVDLVVRHPANEQDLEQELEKRGLKRARVNQVRDDRLEMVELWYALRLRYGEHEEVFADLTQLREPEYQLTAAMLRLTWDGPITIGLVGPPLSYGNGGYAYTEDGNLKTVIQSLSETYAVKVIPVMPGEPLVLDGLDAVFVWGLDRFEPVQHYQFEQWLLAGHPATLLVGGVALDPVYAVAESRAVTDVDSWFDHLGFRVERALVADQSSARVRYTESKPPVLKAYPLFPELKAAGGGLGQEERAHHQINSLVVPWCSPLTQTHPAGVTTNIIGQSSEQAWLQKETYQLDPAKLPGPTQFDQYAIGLKLGGRYNAYFPRPEHLPAENHLARGEHTTLRVWSSEFLLTSIRKAGTLVWVNQTADAMTRQSLTVGIPRRDNAARPLKALTESERKRTRLLSLLAALLLPALIGTAHLCYRRLRSVDPYL